MDCGLYTVETVTYNCGTVEVERSRGWIPQPRPGHRTVRGWAILRLIIHYSRLTNSAKDNPPEIPLKFYCAVRFYYTLVELPVLRQWSRPDTMEAQSLSTCNQCGKKFQRKAHLLRHQQQRKSSLLHSSADFAQRQQPINHSCRFWGPAV